MSQVIERPEQIEQLSAALGVRLFTRAAETFDPLKAADKELLVHGYPARPDAKRYPKQAAIWERMLSRPRTIIEPQFALRTDKRHGIRHAVANDTSTNWSGSVSFAAAGDSVTWVIGQWTVPDVSAPSAGNYYCSAWVGIDGDNSSDVCQAGTESEVVAGVHHTYAWWEWFPNYEVQIANFPVSSGDIMYCAICVHSTTSASVYLTNETTGASTSFTINAPAGTTLKGNCAEWIVEAPTVNGGQSALAKYGDVYFDEGSAGTSKGALLEAGTGTPISMVDGNNNVISTPTFETKELIKLRWV